MKPKYFNISIIFLFLFSTLKLHAEKVEIIGTVFDSDDNAPLAYAHVSIKNKPNGTITNEEGEFKFIISEPNDKDTVIISFVGYESFIGSVNDIKNTKSFYLKPAQIILDETIIRPLGPEELILKSYKKRVNNHYKVPVNHIVFYRETIKENDRFFEFAEGILQLYKEKGQNYQVKLIKGRRNRDIERLNSKNTSNVKIGGPKSILIRDVNNYKWQFLLEENFQDYNYEIKEITSYQGKPVYKIAFDKKENNKNALYKGDIYMETNSLAIIKVDFQLSDLGLKKEQVGPVIKGMMKIAGSELTVGDTKASVSYEEVNNKWVLKNITYDFEIIYNKRKRKYTYLTHKDLLVLSSSISGVNKIPENELMNSSEEFGSQVGEYDEEFWGNYNYLKPTENLKNLLKEFKSESY